MIALLLFLLFLVLVLVGCFVLFVYESLGLVPTVLIFLLATVLTFLED